MIYTGIGLFALVLAHVFGYYQKIRSAMPEDSDMPEVVLALGIVLLWPIGAAWYVLMDFVPTLARFIKKRS